MYDVNKYTDQELYSILDLCNPSDRELEAKIIQMINKYIIIQSEDGKKLANFFNNIYQRFFYQKEDIINNLDEYKDNEETFQDEPDFFERKSIANSPSQATRNWSFPTLRSGESINNIEGFKGIDNNNDKLSIGSSKNEEKENIVTTTKQVEYTRDYINPILKQTIKRIISVDSQYRTTTKDPLSTSFTFNLSEPLRDVLSLSLYSVHIPYTWHTISKTYGANFIYLKSNSKGQTNGDFDYKISVEYGNYSADTFIENLNNSITDIKEEHPDVNFGKTKFYYDKTKSITSFDVDITNIYNQSHYKMVFSDLSTANVFGLTELSYNLNEIRSYDTVSSPENNNNKLYNINSINSKIKIQHVFNLTEPVQDITIDLLNYDANAEDNYNEGYEPNYQYSADAMTLINIINTLFSKSKYLVNSSITYNNNYYHLNINLNRKETTNNYYMQFCVLFIDDSEENLIWSGEDSLFKFSEVSLIYNNENYIYPFLYSNKIDSNSYIIRSDPYINFVSKTVYYEEISFSTETLVKYTYTLSEYIKEINTKVNNLNDSIVDLLVSNKIRFDSSTDPADVNYNLSEFSFNNNIRLTIPYNYYYLDISDKNSFFGSQKLLNGTYKQIMFTNKRNSFTDNNVNGNIDMSADLILYAISDQSIIPPKLNASIEINLDDIDFLKNNSSNIYTYYGIYDINIKFEHENLTLTKNNAKINLSLEIVDPFKLYFKVKENEEYYENLSKSGNYKIQYIKNNDGGVVYNTFATVSLSTDKPLILKLITYDSDDNLLEDYILNYIDEEENEEENKEEKILSMKSFNGNIEIELSNEIYFELEHPNITFDTTGKFNISSKDKIIKCNSSSIIKIKIPKGTEITFNDIINREQNNSEFKHIFSTDLEFSVDLNLYENLKFVYDNVPTNIITNINNVPITLYNYNNKTEEEISIQYKKSIDYECSFNINIEEFECVFRDLKIYETPLQYKSSEFKINTDFVGTLPIDTPTLYIFNETIKSTVKSGEFTLNKTLDLTDLTNNYLYVDVEPYTIDLDKNHIFTFTVSDNDIGVLSNINKLLSIKLKDLIIKNETYSVNIDSCSVDINPDDVDSILTEKELIEKIKNLFNSYQDNDYYNIFSGVRIEKLYTLDGVATYNLYLNIKKEIQFKTQFIDNDQATNSWVEYLNLTGDEEISQNSIMASSERSLGEGRNKSFGGDSAESNNVFIVTKCKKNKKLPETKYSGIQNFRSLQKQFKTNSNIRRMVRNGDFSEVKRRKIRELTEAQSKPTINFSKQNVKNNLPSRDTANRSLPTLRSLQTKTYTKTNIITDIVIGKLITFSKESTITFTPQPYANGLYTEDDTNDIIILIEPGYYTYSYLLLFINFKLFYTPNFGESIFYSTEFSENPFRITFYININKVFTAKDYNVVFYDFYSFVKCYGTSKTRSIAADDTLGWILGYRTYILYDLSNPLNLNQITQTEGEYSNIDENNVAVKLTADTAYTNNIYNYFLIQLDDYTQSHLNDGLVTVTNLDSNVPLPSYASATQVGCNLKTGDKEFLGTTVIGMNQLTQNQLYSAQQVIIDKQSRQNVLVSFSKGPYVQDIFGFIPIKISGLKSGDTIIDSSGPLQNQQRVYFGPVNIRRLTIQLLNDKGEIVDLNGANWSFSFTCEQLYQSRSI
jgi:hypothetical protein